MFKNITYDDAVNNRIFNDTVSKRFVTVIPVHNEEDSIEKTLKSLDKQNISDDLIHDVFIALDNCNDNSESIIENFAKNSNVNIYLLKTVNNSERKVGALNQIYQLFFGNMQSEALSKQHLEAVSNIKYFLGIDADVQLAKNCINILINDIDTKYSICSVSANYTSLLPQSKRKIKSDDPDREYKLAHHEYGGFISRFFASLQNQSFAQWTIEQKVNGYAAEIAGGQCSIFRPEALKNVYDHFKLNGIYDNSTDTEDLLLTQNLRELGWHPVISDKARCYVDSMGNFSSYFNQQLKWQNGKLDYMQKVFLATPYSRKLWKDEIILFLNGIIRLLLITLIPISILMGHFEWNWIWSLPLIVGSILNTVITIKTPNNRFIDILFSLLFISSEYAIWFNFIIHIKAWQNSMRIEKVDGWAKQYQAENGLLKTNIFPIILLLIIIVGFVFMLKYQIISIDSAVKTIKPYVRSGYNILTTLTVFTFIIMLFKLFKFRGHHKA